MKSTVLRGDRPRRCRLRVLEDRSESVPPPVNDPIVAGGPTALALAEGGEIYVSAQSVVHVIDAAGSRASSPATERRAIPAMAGRRPRRS
jgi:hypothetical protein